MAANGIITPDGDGTVRFTVNCMGCGHPAAVDKLDPAQVEAWRAGMLVQDAFPELSASQREVLVSGTHAECFGAMFPDDEDE